MLALGQLVSQLIKSQDALRPRLDAALAPPGDRERVN
jgi:hypothetical protein